MPKLDEIDFQILKILQEEGRKPVAEIARQIKLASPSVHERISKLEQEGIIKGYTAILDNKKLGKDVTAFIGIKVNHAISNGDTVLKELGKIDEILESHTVTGDDDILLKVKTENTTTLEKLITKIYSIKGILNTKTTVVLSTQTETLKIRID
ncbi:MAG: Lrp/AsnC family transcriptional regulator [Candidatus Jordarchaeum sp.]|uniref:Lrp/AsnC family transcriptional regulator n=1 Tax=Candidatus Jordarchaeum sp. TaxID=2823881 RepID=UPI0040499630